MQDPRGIGGYATAMDVDTTKRILQAIRAIPKGEVAGYGEVARRAGLPGRARLVARLLSQNEDRKLPWHRVLRSDGRIAFPEGSAEWREQGARLRSEGVVVENGRVHGQRAAVTAEEALDAAVWGAPPPAPRAKAGKSAAKKKPAKKAAKKAVKKAVKTTRAIARR
ncbi:MGMT family protein [Lysobacter terrestris]|uniref:MGMT family protein n=1 Tax=Agrilutibacter terrestris TaxID=2865112 RepID=A0A7H0FVU9_9GAMM|nr:MGMT family protein [Lysobacter terrestris]